MIIENINNIVGLSDNKNNVIYADLCENEVSLMKSIYKSHNYIITSKSKTLTRNDIKKKHTELYFIKTK